MGLVPEPLEPGKRGCGSRVKGGVYISTPLAPGGRPVEDFLVCPPLPLMFDVPAQGHLPIRHNGVVHLVDWIGRSHYPNVADFVEEVRYMGLSRRVNLNSLSAMMEGERRAVLECLTPNSRLLCVHSRADILNIEDYYDGQSPPRAGWTCPRNREGHPPLPPGMCVGVYWHDIDVEGGVLKGDEDNPRAIWRNMPSFTYEAMARPANVTGLYAPAIFAGFPIHHLEVIRGDEGEHLKALERLQALDFPFEVEVMDE